MGSLSRIDFYASNDQASGILIATTGIRSYGSFVPTEGVIND